MSFAQTFGRQDSLRGALNEFRSCFDVHYYALDVHLDTANHSITGNVRINFSNLVDFERIQIDLFENFNVVSISQDTKKLKFEREGNALFIEFPSIQNKGESNSILVKYSGKPIEAVRPPWDGGFIWSKDQKGRFSLGVACEGLGASSWWPCKDHPSDEPDSLSISVTVPRGLKAICNGQFQGSQTTGKKEKFNWKVSYPINLYNVTLNVGYYSHFTSLYQGVQTEFPLNYYVWEGNEKKAREHFQQVEEMLEIFEDSFGPFPWPRDGYALVESTYWGMEHQSGIAYGNKYENNEFGFDFIIIHESGHEWFGNAVSINDHADMWIHESFTTYMEAVYMEKRFGRVRALKYLLSQRPGIANDKPMLGLRNVNFNEHSIDVYFKGAWMLHTFREALNDDKLWFGTLKKLSMHFRKEMATTEAIIAFFKQELPYDFTAEIEFYLKNKELPLLDYSIYDEDGDIWFERRWNCSSPTFNLPILLELNGEEMLLSASKKTEKSILNVSKKTAVKLLSGRMLYIPNKLEY